MPRTISLNGQPSEEETIVELFDKSYRLRPITRSVQKNLEQVQSKLNSLDEEGDADTVVDLLSDGLDALLAIEGQHRTSAKKMIVERWNADKLSLEQITGYFERLQEAAVQRPT